VADRIERCPMIATRAVRMVVVLQALKSPIVKFFVVNYDEARSWK